MTLYKQKNSFLKPQQSGLFLFGDNALMIVAAVVSLFLQIISFVTTLDGAHAYFAETFKYAPLLFALSVQSVVYFLENTVKFRASLARICALFLAMLCSNYFSYVGIYNNINSPAQYLQETYNSYEKQLTAEYSLIVSESGTSSSDTLNTALNVVSARYGELSRRVSLLEKADAELAAVTDENTAAMTAPNRWSYKDYGDYAAAYSAYIASLSSGSQTETTSRTQTILAQYGFENREKLSSELAQLTAEFNTLSASVESTAENLKLSSDNFSTLLEKLRGKLSTLIEQGEISTDVKNAVTQLITLANGISDSKLSADGIFGAAQLNALSSTALMRSFDELSTGLTESPVALRTVLMRELNIAADRFNTAAEISGNETRYSSESFTIHDIYVLPIMCLISPTKAPMAFLCLCIAVSVDLLSLIFAMIAAKRKPVLALKSTAQAISSDSLLFEKNVISALVLSLRAEYGEDADISDGSLMLRLSRFISRFSPTSVGTDDGYSLYAAQSELSDYGALLAFLSQFGMAKIISPAYFAELSKTAVSDSDAVDGNVVLLKTRFIMWYSELLDREEKPTTSTTPAEVTV